MIRVLGFVLCFAQFALGAEPELRFALHHEPRTLNPLLSADSAAEAVRYLASGVLIRVNRLTQELEPELAQSWKISPDSRSIRFQLRPNIKFSDGTPFTSADVIGTFAMLADRSLHPPVADNFVVGNEPPKITSDSPNTVTLTFADSITGMERLFDQLAILSAKSPLKERASLGPYFIASSQPGVEILLKKNQNYWKSALDNPATIRLSIQSNREIELSRFRQGELDLINNLDPEGFDRLAKEMPKAVHDGGPSTDIEFLWFNLAPASPIPDYRKQWFASTAFRRAVSSAINRDDLCRVVYRGHASPAVGPFSPANRFWFDSKLSLHRFDPAVAAKSLLAEGFQKRGDALFDKNGHAVEFSLITNAGNKNRERMAALIQQDMQTLGIKLNIVTLDMPSLLERITRSSQYEACLLGLTNVDLDPNEMMNVLLSSGRQHAWNPAQKSPATAWEAEMDKLLRAQAAATNRAQRKALFDQVQQIMRREEPYIYLVNANSLSAIGPRVHNAKPAPMFPETFWNIDQISVK